MDLNRLRTPANAREILESLGPHDIGKAPDRYSPQEVRSLITLAELDDAQRTAAISRLGLVNPQNPPRVNRRSG